MAVTVLSEMRNWIHTEHFDYKFQHPNYSKLSYPPSPPIPSFTYHLKRPKVYATRDFPEHFGALSSRFNGKGSDKGFTNVVTADHYDGEKCVGGIPTKTLRNMKSEPPNSYSNINDVEQGKNARHMKEEEEVDAKRAASFNKKRKDHSSVKPVEEANLSAFQHDLSLEAKNKVKKTLNLFRELYNALLDEEKLLSSGKRRFDVEAADRLKKKGKWIHSVKQFGHIPGIAIGDQFHFRAELAVVGLHSQYISGIDYMDLHGTKFATSIVDSGQYENKAKSVDVLIYSGQGGHVGWSSRDDQKLQRGNLALVNSKKQGNPVRVIRKSTRESSYTYDGLYVVNNFWQERNKGKMVFKFELYRMSAQQRHSYKKLTCKECCVMDDVSQGRESMAIRAMNGRDGKRPHIFVYTTNISYPKWYKPMNQCRGCDCINGCSSYSGNQCLCVLKNGGEIPFGEKGTIIGPKDIAYECGPHCKCPPSCMNRVSQQGLRYRLEIFKTESGGWGVRSPSYISSGSFVCEYVGNVEPNQEGGFTIDARKMGNVGRFIRHSSSSDNLFVQRVLYDHEDATLPRIMLFAAKNIRPLQELACDYRKHKMDQISGFQYQLLQL